jgi:glycosyltransferase involved in cell wall biosynthesis
MKMLQIVHGFPPENIAGTEVYTCNLSMILAQRHQVAVFHRENNPAKEEYALTNRDFGNFQTFALNNTFKAYTCFEMTYRNKAIAGQLGGILDQIKPDIVHIQHLLYLGAGLVEEIKKRDIPVVFTLHDYWLACPQGQLLKDNNRPCEGRDSRACMQCVLYQLSIGKNSFKAYYSLKRSIPEPLLQMVKRLYWGYSRFCLSLSKKADSLIEARKQYLREICSKVDMFISPSQFLCNKFSEFDIPGEKIAFCRYGFDLDRFENGEQQLPQRLRFAFVGNILPAKGIHLAIEAFSRIKDERAELKIYGEAVSYKSLVTNYARRLRKIAVNKNISFMGGFDNKEIARIFREIDVLIVPSIWYENSPLVIQEAFAARVPVIASAIGGIPELIEDGINGWLFQSGNVDDLYGRIIRIIQNPSLIEEIRDNIKPPKEIEQNAREMENIYERLAGRC